MAQGEMNCIKFILGAFNFAFLIFGIALMYLGVRTYGISDSIYEILDAPSQSKLAIPIIFVGVFLFIISFLGCWGSFRENSSMLRAYGIILIILMFIQIILGGLIVVFKNTLKDALTTNFEERIAKYNISDPHSPNNQLIDDIQKNLKCCGINNYTDYQNKSQSFDLPLSCCGKLPSTTVDGNFTVNDNSTQVCNENTHPFKEGCFPKVYNLVRENYGPIGGVVITFGIIQILGVLFACILAHSYRQEYHVV